MHGPYRILRGHHQLKADASGSWSGEFGDVNHWEGGAVPGSADDAVFPATSPSEFTLTVNAEYTVHKISFADSHRKVTINGSGKISTVYAGSLANVIGRYNHIILDGASFHSGYQLLHYGTLEVRAGSTFSNGDTFYVWEPYATLVVDGGTCSFRTIHCNDTSVDGGVFVKSGSLSSTKGLTSTKAGRPAVLDVSGGTAEFNSITMSVPGSRLSLSGGTLRVTNTADGSLAVDEGVEVSLTGGTFSWQHDLSDPRFYATDGADVDIGQKFVMVTNGPVTAKSAGALIARGFRNGTEPGCAIDGTFPRIVFTYPDGYFWVASGSYSKFYFNGPTTIGATCNMIVNLGHTMSHTYFKGDLTVDTLDYRDRTTRRTVCTRGLHPTDGEATLTVTGGGTYQLLQSQSYNSFKSVTVESGTTLTLLDRPASVAFGPLVAESFAMEANSALTLNAGANHVQAKTFAIDQSATITVTVPSAFAGAAPVLQTTDLTAPAVSLSQIVLAGSTEGVLLKNENGQVTVYKPGAVLTLDAGGRTATIDEDVAGEGTLVVTNGTLAVNSAAANDVTLKVAAGGALALPCDLDFGALEMQPGSSVAFVDGRTVSLSGPADLAGVAIEPPPGLRDRRGWQTVLVAGGGVSASGCKLPVGFEMRTAAAEGGVALQLRCVHGIMLIVK
ncbi:MAG: hypothetical protein IKE55_02785 [Kiritimatiellae bacterium]|nr:hypothetical protein [Kiritimatiellia bacterium]